MPRPVKQHEVVSSFGSVPDKVAINGHTITIYADNAVYDETASKFITPEDLKRV